MSNSTTEKAFVVIVSNDDDWEGLYINRKLVCEGHKVSVADALDALTGKHLASWETHICDRDWLYDMGNLPDDLDRVKRTRAHD